MTLYYLDTSILLDYYEARGKHGEYIKQFLEKLATTEDIILISDVLIKELLRLGLSIKTILSLFHVLKLDHYLRVQLTKTQRQSARDISLQFKVPWFDAAHTVLAKEYQATLVSYNYHFLTLKYFIEVKTPEELL